MMRIVETTSGFNKKDCVLTIGNFDGVHIGHQEILTAAKRTAAQKGADLVVMTFEPHPVAILHPEKTPQVLTPLELKKYLLAKYDVDYLIVLKDSRKLLNLSAADFVEQFLVKEVQPAIVVEGEDFNFGYGRGGNIRTLYNLGIEKGFEVSVIQTKKARLSIGHSVEISSTIIRNILTSGKVADAAIALGRRYRLIGPVVAGQGKGKQLGFPTANIQPSRQIIPAEGVYAGFVGIGESEKEACAAQKLIPAALSIGRAETYSSDNPLMMEAHLLEHTSGDLVGRWMAMDFVKRIREQLKFETETDLSAQIAKDCEKTKEILTLSK